MLIILVAALLIAGLGAGIYSAVYTSNVQDKYPPQGHQTIVNDNIVHVIERGLADGPLVLMIHGASANANEFTWTLSPRLEAAHRILMVDRPGHGYSERPAGSDRLAVQAEQIAGMLRQLAPGQKAILVGHSFGGAVALRTALDNPDRVKGLVLLAPVTHDWGSGGGSWYNQWAAPAVTGQMFSQIVPLVGPGQAASGTASTFHPQTAPDGYLDKSAVGLVFRPSNFRANARDVQALRSELADQQSRYPALDMPIVVFSGAKDAVLNPSLHVGKLKKQVPVELIALADEGHMPHHAHGSAIADAIQRLASAPATE